MKIYTDGACRGNPGPGGWACVVVKNNQRIAGGSGKCSSTTNNQMELRAILEGLRYCIKNNISEVEIVSDSKYCIQGATEWLEGWRRRGWKNAAGAPVKNREMWELLAEYLAKVNTKFTWVKGHAGDKFNEMVDQMAVAASLSKNK